MNFADCVGSSPHSAFVFFGLFCFDLFFFPCNFAYRSGVGKSVCIYEHLNVQTHKGMSNSRAWVDKTTIHCVEAAFFFGVRHFRRRRRCRGVMRKIVWECFSLSYILLRLCDNTKNYYYDIYKSRAEIEEIFRATKKNAAQIFNDFAQKKLPKHAASCVCLYTGKKTTNFDNANTILLRTSCIYQ